MKILHFLIITTLCIVASCTQFSYADASIPLIMIAIQGGANSPSCGNACITPQNITISKGTAVEWINNDLVLHSITSGISGHNDSGVLFNSGTIFAGKYFIHNFNNIGTFHYFDPNYTFDAGTIVVTESPIPISLPVHIPINPTKTISDDSLSVPSYIRQRMYDWCYAVPRSNGMDVIDPKILQFVLDNNPNALDNAHDIDAKNKLVNKQYWEILQTLLISNTTEFHTLGGNKSSIKFLSGFSLDSCPPIVAINGTFTTLSDDDYNFLLNYDANKFSYNFSKHPLPSYFVSYGSSETKNETVTLPKQIDPPLQQFKSGVAANDVICRPDMQLLIQNQENRPICVKLDHVSNLLHRDWSYPVNCNYAHDSFTAGVEGLVIIEKNADDPASGKSYFPQNSTVVIGWNNTVSWINHDLIQSSVTSNWNLFDSGPILPEHEWKHTFECAGNYGYHSEPHPWMKGWIRVLPPSR